MPPLMPPRIYASIPHPRGGGEYPEGYDGADLVDPSDIPLCEDYEATGACPGGDDCPLIHGDKCEVRLHAEA